MTIRTLQGNDVIDGSTSSSDDTFDGGSGNDRMLGGIGNTTYIETPGSAETPRHADVIVDSGGIDTIDFSQASLGVRFDLGLSQGQVQVVDTAGNSMAVTGTLENVIGTPLDDDLTGNALG